MSKPIVTFPHMGNLRIGAKALLEALELEVIVPPPTTKHTLSLGSQHGPEFACLPLKINLGNFMEAAALGANTVVMAGGVGPCRFGYYAQVEREILQDLGYNLKMLVLEPPDKHFSELLTEIRSVTGNASLLKIIKALRFAWKKVKAVDGLERRLHYLRPREARRGQAEAIYRKGLDLVDQAADGQEIKQAVEWSEQSFGRLKLKPARDYLKIGLVGEIYCQLDPFANMDIEKRLGEMGVEVARSIYLSEWVNEHLFLGLVPGVPDSREARRMASPYINHFLGGHGQDSVGSAIRFQQGGFDGIIQMAPLTCMPEIVAQSVFNTVRKDRALPTMTLIMDEQSGEAGLVTRLEAFIDMLQRRKLQQQEGVVTGECVPGY
ncbi:MAG TPA: CoA protein activase [Bacillota bacterium]|nr:CoA protein activase [Bacillota bacterium]